MKLENFNISIKRIMGEPIKKVLIKILFPFRNNFILFNIWNRAKKNTVNLNYWNESNNLGDTLSPIVVDYILSLKDFSREHAISGKKHLYAIGSVLTAGIQDATVWGSGILNASLLYRVAHRKLDIRAVRGPFTRAMLMDYGYDVPEVYGDPAILMPEIYFPEKIEKSHKYGLIIHKDYNLNKVMNKESELKDVLQIDICTDDYKEFIRKLTSVEVIISSSLHGIILAESYGIRAILLQPQIDIVKYFDYYLSTRRLDFPIATTLEEAKKILPIDLPQNLNELREDLKRSFPYDLYY